MNKVILTGRIGRDPELSESGKTPRCKLRLGTDGYKGATDWHNVVVFGKRAEACAKYLSKGRTVCVEGRIQHRSWTDSEGQKRHATEVVAGVVEFLDRPADLARDEEPETIPTDADLNIPAEEAEFEADDRDLPEIEF